MPNIINGSIDGQEELRGTLSQETPVIEAELSVPSTGVVVGDYELLNHKPRIEGVELSGELTLEDFGLVPVTNAEIDEICIIPVESELEEEEPNE